MSGCTKLMAEKKNALKRQNTSREKYIYILLWLEYIRNIINLMQLVYIYAENTARK